jgi:hypothetical protein
MALENIASRLTGYFPKLAKSEAYNLANDAWTDIRNDRLWSFQLVEDSIATPNLLNAGSFTTVQGTSIVTADATASAAIIALTGLPFITQRQFRITNGGIYNIVGVDATIPAAVVLTLDRIYTDPSGVNQPYQIYQCYFPAPVPDFKRWLDWRDLTNGDWLSIYMTRREVNWGDPQRLYFTFPHWVVPFQTDMRRDTAGNPYATFGSMLYELYPNPLSYVSYMRYWVRKGSDLVQPQDAVPYPMTDDIVLAKAKMNAATLAESNRDPSVGRGQSADYKFIYQAAEKEYGTKLKIVGLADRDLVDNFLLRLPRALRDGNNFDRLPYYSSISNRAYYGG